HNRQIVNPTPAPEQAMGGYNAANGPKQLGVGVYASGVTQATDAFLVRSVTVQQAPPWNAATSTWSGNAASVTMQVGSSTTVAVNVNGSTLFPQLFSGLQAFHTALGPGPSAVHALMPALQNDLPRSPPPAPRWAAHARW
ncbi:MAG: hypothetical protein ACP5QO_17735, partial [Clostridia bacterium]